MIRGIPEGLRDIVSLCDRLLSIAREVKPLYYIEPVNARAQREQFLEGRIRNPDFRYRRLEYEPRKTEERLKSIRIPKNALGLILEKKKEEVLLQNRIIARRGDERLVRQLSIRLYGAPDDDLVSYAEGLLKEYSSSEIMRDLPAGELRAALAKSLYGYGLNDWDVELSDKRLTTVYPAEKRITVCRDRMFSASDLERLKVHEIGVHALRTANGNEQPLKIFAAGLPGYLSSEEGLSIYAEEVTGNIDGEVMRDYAARVIAADAVCRDMDFRAAFERLRGYGLDEAQAWNALTRAYRGGGYVKDHVYLQGYRKVKSFAEAGGDFGYLYLGKIGVEDVPMVTGLVEDGVLKEARFKPEFFSELFNTQKVAKKQIHSKKGPKKDSRRE